jgi:Zn-dependent peptidase ImmA (M78 family)
MKSRNTQCSVSVAISDNEKDLFAAIARYFRVSRNALMRRLVRYFLDEKISWETLLKHGSEMQVANEPHQGSKKYISAKLEPEEYFPFARYAEDRGSTPGIALKKLISSYVSGKIERGDIWQ